MRKPSFNLSIIVGAWVTVIAGITFCCLLVAFVVKVIVINITGIR